MLSYRLIQRGTLVLAALILSGCGEPVLQGSDADMKHIFRRHSYQFYRLVNMAEHDRAQVLWVMTHEMQPSDASLPEERWQEYDNLCAGIGVRRIERLPGRVELDAGSESDDFSHGTTKGYILSTTVPGPLVDSLDGGLPPDLLKGDKGIAYSRLSSNWYLFLRRD